MLLFQKNTMTFAMNNHKRSTQTEFELNDFDPIMT